MSEVDFIVKLLEYSLNSGYPQPAIELVNELINFRAQITITSQMNFRCSSHDFFMNTNELILKYPRHISDPSRIVYFKNCEHYICKDCLAKYIRETFDRLGISYLYVCPACHANCSQNKTPLILDSPYFTDVVSLEEQRASLEQSNISLQTVTAGRIGKLKQSVCYFAENPGLGFDCKRQGRLERIPCCQKKICQDCIQIGLDRMADTDDLNCLIPICNRPLAHELILELLIQGTRAYTLILPKLRINGRNAISCPDCARQSIANTYEQFFECQCGYKICPRCSLGYHPDVPCFVRKNAMKEYREIECKENDEIYEYKAMFLHALSLFEWDLNKNGIANLKAFKLKVKKVTYIYNPDLQEKYNRSKQKMIDKGINPGEIFVFHGSDVQNIPLICKTGFLIGGIDRTVRIGTAYGFGVYTATDPTMSICYYQTKLLIACKALKGLESDHPIKDKNEFMATQFNSFYVDFHGSNSNFYIFLQKENVLPYYTIEYE
jgi:hypothetical protein